jgi:hypothetical protein
MGPPAAIIPRDAGAAVVCSACGAEFLFALTEGAENAEDGADGACAATDALVEPTPCPPVLTAPMGDLTGDAVESLVRSGIDIDPGDGPMRCPKCGFRQPVSASCARCGLAGDPLAMPADSWGGDVPQGGAGSVQELDVLWKAVTETGLSNDPDAGREFLLSARRLEVLDRAARLIRLHAQDTVGTDEGEAAAALLGRVIERSHAEFLMAEGSGGHDAMVLRTQTVMRVLYIGVAVFSVLVLLAILISWVSGSA